MSGSLAALKAAHSSVAITTRPIAPMTVGLREANERPRGAVFSLVGHQPHLAGGNGVGSPGVSWTPPGNSTVPSILHR